MSFDPIRLLRQFPELHGFVLFDPARLLSFLGQEVRGGDLLTRFSQTEDGDRVSSEGIAIPFVGLDAGDYTILVRDADTPGISQPPRLRSPGWILGTETGELRFGGLGYLMRFDPDHPKLARLRVPPGWYRVELLGHVLAPGRPEEEWLYEVVLSLSEEKPRFQADLAASLSITC